MLEVGLNPLGDLGDAFHDPHRLVHQVVVLTGRLQMQGRLEIVVQGLVRVGRRPSRSGPLEVFAREFMNFQPGVALQS